MNTSIVSSNQIINTQASSLDYISENEKWIPGYRNFYSCTRDGKIFTHHHGKYEELKISYIYNKDTISTHICLSRNGISKGVSAQRIVYETWVRPLADNEFVKIKNGDPSDLRIENLEVCQSKHFFQVLIEDPITKELLYFEGNKNCKQVTGFSGTTIYAKIREALDMGLDYFMYKCHRYEFISDVAFRAAWYFSEKIIELSYNRFMKTIICEKAAAFSAANNKNNENNNSNSKLIVE